MKDNSPLTSSTADVLVQSIKEDLTTFITERQELAHREKVGINTLNELIQRQKEVGCTAHLSCVSA